MALDIEKIRNRQSETKAQQVGNRWQPRKEGINHLRVFKYVHEVVKQDVSTGAYRKEKLGKKVDEIDRPVVVQYGTREDNRPVLANEKSIAEYRELMNGDKTEQARAKQIKPSTRYLLNVVDTDEKPTKMRFWMCPKIVYNQILGTILDPDFGEDVLGPEGRDFSVKVDREAGPAGMYSVNIRDKEKSPKLPSNTVGQVIDFYAPKWSEKVGLASSSEASGPTEAGESKNEEPTVVVEAEEEPVVKKPVKVVAKVEVEDSEEDLPF